MDELLEHGARMTADPLPGEAFDDELIAFAYVAGGLNIEIIDTDKRRNLL
jgi:methylmalonyl-CoA/ethylmalonyl-CoA epimerase